jgi:hypothetical protein
MAFLDPLCSFKPCCHIMLMTRDGTTSGSPYALGIHGIRVLLPGLRVGALRLVWTASTQRPERKIKPVNDTELDHETFHE